MPVLRYIFLFAFIFNLNAQTTWTFKIGGNISSFQDHDCEPSINYSMGISKNIIYHKNLSILGELLFTKQGAVIKNVPIKTEDWELTLSAYDISASILYAELPLLFGYNQKFQKVKLMLYVGPSIRTTIKDDTEKSNEQVIYDSPENENYEEYQNYTFEFVQGDYGDPTFFKNTAWGVNIGLLLDKEWFSIEIRYTNVLEPVGQIGQFMPIDRKLETFNFMLGYNF